MKVLGANISSNVDLYSLAFAGKGGGLDYLNLKSTVNVCPTSQQRQTCMQTNVGKTFYVAFYNHTASRHLYLYPGLLVWE